VEVAFWLHKTILEKQLNTDKLDNGIIFDQVSKAFPEEKSKENQ